MSGKREKDGMEDKGRYIVERTGDGGDKVRFRGSGCGCGWWWWWCYVRERCRVGWETAGARKVGMWLGGVEWCKKRWWWWRWCREGLGSSGNRRRTKRDNEQSTILLD